MFTATANPPPHVVEDYGFLQVNSDGSVVRTITDSRFLVVLRDDGTVEWKDLQYDTTHDLQLRLYRPRARRPPGGPKLPVLFYFHGGGFFVGSRTLPNFHNWCLRLAAELNAIVIAPDYRLAPEHRLPAAIEDALSAAGWLRAQAASQDPDAWLAEDADFTRTFISGDPAGGTIAHHLAALSAVGQGEASPVQIGGYVLLMPGFVGTQLTKSEAESPDDGLLTLEGIQLLHRLALPVGATADHPLASPFAPGAPRLETAEIGPMLVVIGGCDLLRDREVDYVKRLQGWGKPVEMVEFPGQQHAFFTVDAWSVPADELVRVIKRFMSEKVPSKMVV